MLCNYVYMSIPCRKCERSAWYRRRFWMEGRGGRGGGQARLPWLTFFFNTHTYVNSKQRFGLQSDAVSWFLAACVCTVHPTPFPFPIPSMYPLFACRCASLIDRRAADLFCDPDVGAHLRLRPRPPRPCRRPRERSRRCTRASSPTKGPSPPSARPATAAALAAAPGGGRGKTAM